MRLTLALALALSAGRLLPAAETIAERSHVTIDVVVEDSRGRVVDTLGPADFSVTEQSRPPDGRRRALCPCSAKTPALPRCRSAHRRRPRTRTPAAWWRSISTSSTSTPGPAADRARDALIRLVTDGVDPSDEVIVLKSLDSLLDIRPTKDHREAIQKLEAFDPRRGDYRTAHIVRAKLHCRDPGARGERACADRHSHRSKRSRPNSAASMPPAKRSSSSVRDLRRAHGDGATTCCRASTRSSSPPIGRMCRSIHSIRRWRIRRQPSNPMTRPDDSADAIRWRDASAVAFRRHGGENDQRGRRGRIRSEAGD